MRGSLSHRAIPRTFTPHTYSDINFYCVVFDNNIVSNQADRTAFINYIGVLT